jgi:hypothetical protein
MIKNWKKFASLQIFLFFSIKNAIDFFLGFHKGRPSYRRSLQPSKVSNTFSAQKRASQNNNSVVAPFGLAGGRKKTPNKVRYWY